MISKEEIEFLKESNAIEREYSKEALEDAIKAWKYARRRGNLIKIDINYISKIHELLMKRLYPRIAGKIRDIPIYVGTYQSCKEQMKPEKIMDALQKLVNPALNPILSEEWIRKWHVKFESIHPFEDGNGRVGRILMNMQRLRLGLPLLIIHEGPEQNEYYEWFSEDDKKYKSCTVPRGQYCSKHGVIHKADVA